MTPFVINGLRGILRLEAWHGHAHTTQRVARSHPGAAGTTPADKAAGTLAARFMKGSLGLCRAEVSGAMGRSSTTIAVMLSSALFVASAASTSFSAAIPASACARRSERASRTAACGWGWGWRLAVGGGVEVEVEVGGLELVLGSG